MATIDITEQALGTQSSTFKIEDLEKTRAELISMYQCERINFEYEIIKGMMK